MEVRTCRACGCTQDDCRQCVERTGLPCFWVEKDLCSACCHDDKKFLFERGLQALSHIRMATTGDSWRVTSEPQDNAIFGSVVANGKKTEYLVATGLLPQDARFLELAHNLIPPLLEEYRRLKGFYDYHDRKQRFSK